jgi:hypothetical protein
MSKIIKLMADYDCFPTWEVFDDGTENINPDSLDISDQLKKDLEVWSDAYDQTINIDDPGNSKLLNPDLEKKIETEGKRLWSELKKQLNPSYKVLYFSEQSRLIEH